MLHTGNFFEEAALSMRLRTLQWPKSTEHLAHSRSSPCFFLLFCFVFFLLAIKRNILTTSRICWKAENDRLTLSKRTKPVGFTRSGVCVAQSNHLQISSTGQKENHVLAIKQNKALHFRSTRCTQNQMENTLMETRVSWCVTCLVCSSWLSRRAGG